MKVGDLRNHGSFKTHAQEFGETFHLTLNILHQTFTHV